MFLDLKISVMFFHWPSGNWPFYLVLWTLITNQRTHYMIWYFVSLFLLTITFPHHHWWYHPDEFIHYTWSFFCCSVSFYCSPNSWFLGVCDTSQNVWSIWGANRWHDSMDHEEYFLTVELRGSACQETYLLTNTAYYLNKYMFRTHKGLMFAFSIYHPKQDLVLSRNWIFEHEYMNDWLNDTVPRTLGENIDGEKDQNWVQAFWIMSLTYYCLSKVEEMWLIPALNFF